MFMLLYFFKKGNYFNDEKAEEIGKQKYTPGVVMLKKMNITLTLKFDSTWL